MDDTDGPNGVEHLYSETVRTTMDGSVYGGWRSIRDADAVPLSFGFPYPDSFRNDELVSSAESLLEAEANDALQYGGGESAEALPELIVERAADRGIDCTTAEVHLTNGATNAIDTVSQTFLDPGDTVFVESPTFMGALRLFRNYGVDIEGCEMDADGLDVQRYVGMGCDHAGWGQLFLDDVRLPASERLGDHDAFKVIMRNFDSNRGWIPLFCLGGARQSLDETEEYLTERETFGQPVASYQGPQFEIAELETKYEAARLKAYESLWLADEGETNTKAAAQAKWYGVDTAREIIHDCMVLHGNYGYSEGFNFSKRLRDVMGLEIGEGPPQIQKLVIAREVFGREYLPTK